MNDLAKKVNHFFFILNCGTICPLNWPITRQLGFLESNYCLNKWDNSKMLSKKQEIFVTWTSTDGFKGSGKYLTNLKKKKSKILHIFDYVHLVKLGRNQLLNKCLEFPLFLLTNSLLSLLKAQQRKKKKSMA